jgi:ribosome-associated protein
MEITPALRLDDNLIEERFVRASGPGGQNVNKVSTAVQLRVALAALAWPDDVKARLRALAGSRLTQDDVIVIDAREHRTQVQNREAARARLHALLEQAARRPRPRRPTRPTRAAKERRVDTKQRRSALKRRRSRASDDD